MFRQLSCLIFALGCAGAQADVTLTYAGPDGRPDLRYYVADGKIRIEDPEADSVMLYDASGDTLTFIDTASREYSVLDPAARERLQKEMGGAMAEMKAQLEAMPPEQRKMMEGMMGGFMKALEPEVEKTGEERSVAGYDCAVIRITVAAALSSEVCVAEPGEVGVSAADYATMKRMGESMQQLADDILQGLGGNLSAFNDLDGVAVSMTEDGETSTLKSVSDASIPAERFAVPEGYTRKAFDE